MVPLLLMSLAAWVLARAFGGSGAERSLEPFLSGFAGSCLVSGHSEQYRVIRGEAAAN